jgi:F-type H+-transporting ATPase subunit epsilon
MAYRLDIVTPERTLFSGEVLHLRVPGTEGSFGVLKGHVPMLSAMHMGQLRFRQEGRGQFQVATSGGFVEVQGEQVTVLAETAEFGTEIDIDRANEARDRALKRLAEEHSVDEARAKLALNRALNRLIVSEPT